MQGTSLHWFVALFGQQRTGDFAGAFTRSMLLALLVLTLTVCMSVIAGLAFRRRFPGSTFVFYLAVASLIMPGILVGLGVGLTFQLFEVPTCGKACNGRRIEHRAGRARVAAALPPGAVHAGPQQRRSEMDQHAAAGVFHRRIVAA
jgi:hypothetical protein